VTPLDELRAAVEAAAADLRNGASPAGTRASFERPKQAGFGDYSTNAAMLLAPALKAPPREIAERLGERVRERLGDAVDRVEGAAVGAGTHPFRDPRLVEDFAAPRPGIDVSQWHTYAVDWRPDGAAFSVDGLPVRRVEVTPDYPVQAMLAVFDFPEQSGKNHVPSFAVDHIRHRVR
jgi:hypothetical protein